MNKFLTLIGVVLVSTNAFAGEVVEPNQPFQQGIPNMVAPQPVIPNMATPQPGIPNMVNPNQVPFVAPEHQPFGAPVIAPNHLDPNAPHSHFPHGTPTPCDNGVAPAPGVAPQAPQPQQGIIPHN